MPSPRLLVLSLVVGVICATALAACGSDDEGTIPQADADAMLVALQNARDERETQDCVGLQDAVGNLKTEIGELPDTVDQEVRTALTQGAENLAAQAADDETCSSDGTTGPQDPQDTTDDTTEPPVTTPPATTPPEDEEEPPPEQPSNEGGGGLGEGNQDGEPPGGGPPANPPGQGTPPTGGTGGEEGDD